MMERCHREHLLFIPVDGRESHMTFCCKYHKEQTDLMLLEVPMPKFLEKIVVGSHNKE